MNALTIQHHLQTLANPIQAEKAKRFFKTGQGQYSANDQFWGITVPSLRAYLKQCPALELSEIAILLSSAFHEQRLFALLLLVRQFSRGDAAQQTAIYDFYLGHTEYINNWDLVDSSASYIVGSYLLQRDKDILYTLAVSPNMWQRRIAIIATWHFIRHQQFNDTLKLAAILRNDKEDLLHKAVGWMLREVGKRDLTVEQAFLQQHYQHMPRTMLRYAIEKFAQEDRLRYLRGEV